jgi:serine protease
MYELLLGGLNRSANMFMKLKPVVAAVACALMLGTAVAADKTSLSPLMRGKSATVGEISQVLATAAKVRVIVRVEMGLSAEALEQSLDNAATRGAAKARIRQAIDAVLADHAGPQGTARGAPAITRLTTVPAFAITVTLAELEALARDRRVVAIDIDRRMIPHLDTTLPLIGMDVVNAGGGTGVNRTVVVIDTGVQRDHIFTGLTRLIAGQEACFLDFAGCPNGLSEMIGTGAGAAQGSQSHGTHVSGIVLGNRAAGSPLKGVARRAKLIPINIFGTAGSTSFSTIQRAFEHVEDVVIADPTLRISSINMSVGGGNTPGNCDDDPTMALLKPVIDRLRSRNVLSVISAGNNSTTTNMSFPACLSSMVSVAATSKTGIVSSYTSISRTTDLFGPGGDFPAPGCVVSSVPTNSFAAFCGTSMAAPHVAGAIAVLKQKVPAANHCRIENALKQTGIATTDTRGGGLFTKPRIQVDAALGLLLSPVAPANDNFGAASVIPAATTLASFFGSNLDATLEAGEPNHVVATSTDSVWWRWTPSATGSATIDTIGSGSDTVLAIYTGASVAALGVPVARNNNISATNRASRVTFTATAGTIYRIAVAGLGGKPECTIQLNVAH